MTEDYRQLEADGAAAAHVDERLAGAGSLLPPPRVRHAVALIAGRADATLRGIAATLGVTERSLHRDLVAWTGHAPKVLARILRMQRALARIRAGSSLVAVAGEEGYADQAHMTRELRRLTGDAPSALRSPHVRNVQDGPAAPRASSRSRRTEVFP